MSKNATRSLGVASALDRIETPCTTAMPTGNMPYTIVQSPASGGATNEQAANGDRRERSKGAESLNLEVANVRQENTSRCKEWR